MYWKRFEGWKNRLHGHEEATAYAQTNAHAQVAQPVTMSFLLYSIYVPLPIGIAVFEPKFFVACARVEPSIGNTLFACIFQIF